MPITTFSKSSSKADPVLARDQLTLLQMMYNSYGREIFCQIMLWILAKKAEKGAKAPIGSWNKRLIPYRMNRMQRDLNNKQTWKNIIAKMRQGGLTTDRLLNRILVPSVITPGSNGLLISQTKGYAAKHFAILHRAVRYFGAADPFNNDNPANDLWHSLSTHLLHLKYSPRAELVFDMLDNTLMIESSENPEAGQGVTISHLVCSEVARWAGNPEETMANAKESVHSEGTIDVESTANGLGGYFHEEYQRAGGPESEFARFFYEWWWMDEYTNEEPVDKKTVTEEEKELCRQFQLDLKQIAWRRVKKIALRREFDEKYPESDVKMFLTSGYKFFDTDELYMQLLRLKNEKLVAEEEISPGLPHGFIRLFKRRIVGHQYIGAGDPARGIYVTGQDTDFHSASFIDVETGEDVAAIRARGIPPEDFGELMVTVGKMYNNATLAVERTGDGHSVMLAFKEAQYPNVYMHQEWDRENKKIYTLPGWPATTVTRPIACNRLARFIRDYPDLIRNVQFINEAMTFIRNSKNGKPEGAPGTHDDCVSSRYIAEYCRLVSLGWIDPIEAHRERYGATEEAPS